MKMDFDAAMSGVLKVGDLFPWEPPACGKGNGDGRIQVGAGDVTDGVDHDHDGKSPHETYAREGDHSLAQVNGDRSTAREYEEVGSKNFSNHL